MTIKGKGGKGHCFTNLPYPSGKSLSSVIEIESPFGPLVERQLAVEEVVVQAQGPVRKLEAIFLPNHCIALSSPCAPCTSCQHPKKCIGPARLHLLALSEKVKYRFLW